MYRYLKDRIVSPIRDFRTVDCERLLQVIAIEYDMSTTTLKHIKNLMSGLLRHALRTGVLNGVNPIQAVCIPKAHPPKETNAYDLPIIQKILEALPPDARTVVAIAAFTGLRKGELRTLRPENYDGSSLKIKRAAWRKHVNTPKGKQTFNTPKGKRHLHRPPHSDRRPVAEHVPGGRTAEELHL